MLQSLHVSPVLLVMLGACLVLVVVLALVGKVPLSYNVRNLLVRWRITFLTALAFTLVVGLLTVMLAFVNGMDRLTENSGQAANVMILSDGATDELFSNLPKTDTTNVQNQDGVETAALRDEDGKERPYRLCSKEVYIVANQPIQPAALPRPGPQVTGKITALTPEADGFTLITPEGQSQSFRLSDAAREAFRRVKVDDRVMAAYEDRGGERWVTEIKVSGRRRFVQVRGLEDHRISSLVHNMQLYPLGEGRGKGPEVRGHVQSVTEDLAGFTVADASGKEQKFRVTETTKVPINLLQKGQEVMVVYDPEGDAPPAREVWGVGKWWAPAGVQDEVLPKGAKAGLPLIQAVLGEGVARVLGADKNKPSLVVGDTFELGPRKWIVTGIMRASGSTFGSEVWAKHSVVGPMFGKEQFTSLVVRAKNAETASKLADFYSNDYTPKVRAETEPVYYSKLTSTNLQFSIAIYFVTIIMAIGGVFGVMNTMFAAIAQRTKDIGVLGILGFTRWQILVSFFLETLTIALVGGLLGCAVGMLVDGWSATSIVSSGPGGGGKTVALKLTVDAGVLAKGLLFTLIMGALGGLIPAWTATRLRPLESLR